MSEIIPIQNLLSPGKYNLKCPVEYDENKVRNIIVHNTANDASASNEIAYMIGNGSATSFHFAIDDKEVVQGVPLSKGTFSCGNRNGDVFGISIEICYSKSGGDRFAAAEKLAAQFIAQLLAERGWATDRVTKHQDYDGKYCPHRTLDMGWQRFLNMIKNYMEDEIDMTKAELQQIIGEEISKANPRYKYFEDIPKWAKPSVQKLIQEGKLNGRGKDEKGLDVYDLSDDMVRCIKIFS